MIKNAVRSFSSQSLCFNIYSSGLPQTVQRLQNCEMYVLTQLQPFHRDSFSTRYKNTSCLEGDGQQSRSPQNFDIARKTWTQSKKLEQSTSLCHSPQKIRHSPHALPWLQSTWPGHSPQALTTVHKLWLWSQRLDGPRVPAVLPLLPFFLVSVGLKWMEGIGHTSCIGSASLRTEFLCSQPAPCR